VGDKVELDCYGDVVPCANTTYDLGSTSRYWDNIYVNSISTANGTLSFPLANVHTVAKSGGDFTTIQAAINHAAPSASATSPQLIRIAPGIYDEAITLSSYVHLASVGGSYGTVIIQQTDADICTLPIGANNISGVVFRLVLPSAGRSLFKDDGHANYCYLENVQFEIGTPGAFAHKLLAISGASVFVLNNVYANVGGTGASVGIDISSQAVVASSGMEMSFANVNAFNVKCTASAQMQCMNTVLGGTSSLFNVTNGIFTWTGCRLSATGTGVINTNSKHYAENCFIDSGVYCQNGAEVRLRNCSYKYVYRTGTGNILDTTRKLPIGIFHTVDFTWNTVIASANAFVRKSGTGDIQTGGSGQGVAGVRLNSVSYAGIENNADVTGGLDSSFTCARTIRMHQSASFNQFAANGKIFIGVRQTVGNAIPTLAGAENYAGFVWDGTACKAQSSNGGGVGQSTTITTPTVDQQNSIEIEILGSNRVDFYCNGVLVASHSTAAGLPSGLVDWQRLITSDGGGDSSYMYMTLRTGFISECPQ
jgi:hypothetical protein